MEDTEIKNEVDIPAIIVTDWPDEEPESYITGRERQLAALKPHQFKPGVIQNPGGKPKGPTLKHFAREYLSKMTLEQRLEFMAGLDKLDIWRMAEGNPSEDKNITVSVPKPILGGITQGSKEVETLYPPKALVETSPREGVNKEDSTLLYPPKRIVEDSHTPVHTPSMQGQGTDKDIYIGTGTGVHEAIEGTHTLYIEGHTPPPHAPNEEDEG